MVSVPGWVFGRLVWRPPPPPPPPRPRPPSTPPPWKKGFGVEDELLPGALPKAGHILKAGHIDTIGAASEASNAADAECSHTTHASFMPGSARADLPNVHTQDTMASFPPTPPQDQSLEAIPAGQLSVGDCDLARAPQASDQELAGKNAEEDERSSSTRQ
jgi:hypothetical protein